jgi:hypothetical protein
MAVLLDALSEAAVVLRCVVSPDTLPKTRYPAKYKSIYLSVPSSPTARTWIYRNSGLIRISTQKYEEQNHINLKSEIVAAIKTGMTNACSDMHYFTAQPQLCFNAEYLFTVATAKAINDHNFVPGHKFEIRIEHSTQKFARDCLPLLERVTRWYEDPQCSEERLIQKLIVRGGSISRFIMTRSMEPPSVAFRFVQLKLRALTLLELLS